MVQGCQGLVRPRKTASTMSHVRASSKSVTKAARPPLRHVTSPQASQFSVDRRCVRIASRAEPQGGIESAWGFRFPAPGFARCHRRGPPLFPYKNGTKLSVALGFWDAPSSSKTRIDCSGMKYRVAYGTFVRSVDYPGYPPTPGILRHRHPRIAY